MDVIVHAVIFVCFVLIINKTIKTRNKVALFSSVVIALATYVFLYPSLQNLYTTLGIQNHDTLVPSIAYNLIGDLAIFIPFFIALFVILKVIEMNKKK